MAKYRLTGGITFKVEYIGVAIEIEADSETEATEIFQDEYGPKVDDISVLADVMVEWDDDTMEIEEVPPDDELPIDVVLRRMGAPELPLVYSKG